MGIGSRGKKLRNAVCLLIDKIAPCEKYEESTGEGCQAESCDGCPWIYLCKDCEQYEKGCDFKGKPKIMAFNRRAINDWIQCKEFQVLPRGPALYKQENKILWAFHIISDELAKRNKSKEKDG